MAPLTAEQKDELFYIRKSAQQLSDLVDDLLDIAKVEAGKIEVRPAPFEVGAAVRRAARHAAAAARSTNRSRSCSRSRRAFRRSTRTKPRSRRSSATSSRTR